jgi:hypothetical protein
VDIYLENVFEFKIKINVEVDAIEIRNWLNWNCLQALYFFCFPPEDQIFLNTRFDYLFETIGLPLLSVTGCH